MTQLMNLLSNAEVLKWISLFLLLVVIVQYIAILMLSGSTERMAETIKDVCKMASDDQSVKVAKQAIENVQTLQESNDNLRKVNQELIRKLNL